MDERLNSQAGVGPLNEVLDAAASYRHAMSLAPDGGPDGLTLLVLLAVVEQPGRSPADIARRCVVRPQEVARALGKLRERGLIKTRESGAGKRGQEVATDSGVVVVDDLLERISRLQRP